MSNWTASKVFIFSQYPVQFEECAKRKPTGDSPPRTVLRAFRTPQDAFSSRNTPFAEWGALSIFEGNARQLVNLSGHLGQSDGFKPLQIVMA